MHVCVVLTLKLVLSTPTTPISTPKSVCPDSKSKEIQIVWPQTINSVMRQSMMYTHSFMHMYKQQQLSLLTYAWSASTLRTAAVSHTYGGSDAAAWHASVTCCPLVAWRLTAAAAAVCDAMQKQKNRCLPARVSESIICRRSCWSVGGWVDSRVTGITTDRYCY